MPFHSRTCGAFGDLASEGTGGGACRAFVPESESESDELEDDELDDDDSEEDESFALDFLDFTAVALVARKRISCRGSWDLLSDDVDLAGSSSELLSVANSIMMLT